MRTRNKSIPIRVTEKELQAIDEAAKKAKKNRTEYLISAALGKEITVIEDLREMIVQLKRIGNNLNQIALKINSKRFFFGKFDSVIEGQRKIYDAILSLTGDES